MNYLDIMKQRHSVRQYKDDPIPEDIHKELSDEVDKLNKESGFHMQIFFDEPECFDSMMARYGKFIGVKNYLAIVGKKSIDLEERAGYYGQKVVLFAQSKEINSCWVGMTHGKSKAVINKDEKQIIVIFLGYGVTQGVAHKSKPTEDLSSVSGDVHQWFKRGMQAAMLSPTAINQQKFMICYDGLRLTAKCNGSGFFSKLDLGIVKCDFELASVMIKEFLYESEKCRPSGEDTKSLTRSGKKSEASYRAWR